jgi:O-antigen/teichoic acid export membrane protein
VEKMVHLSFCLLVVPAFVVSICSYFYSQDLMGFLYRKTTHAAESASVFRILMFCFIPISSTYIFGTLLTANGNLKQLNIMAATGMIINVTLNLILIPLFKVEGSAVSSLITQVLTAGAQIIMVNYIFRFHINYRLLSSLVLFIILVATVSWYVHSHLHAHFLVGLILSAGIGLGLALLLRIISLRNLYYIVKYEQ